MDPSFSLFFYDQSDIEKQTLKARRRPHPFEPCISPRQFPPEDRVPLLFPFSSFSDPFNSASERCMENGLQKKRRIFREITPFYIILLLKPFSVKVFRTVWKDFSFPFNPGRGRCGKACALKRNRQAAGGYLPSPTPPGWQNRRR